MSNTRTTFLVNCCLILLVIQFIHLQTSFQWRSLNEPNDRYVQILKNQMDIVFQFLNDHAEMLAWFHLWDKNSTLAMDWKSDQFIQEIQQEMNQIHQLFFMPDWQQENGESRRFQRDIQQNNEDNLHIFNNKINVFTILAVKVFSEDFNHKLESMNQSLISCIDKVDQLKPSPRNKEKKTQEAKTAKKREKNVPEADLSEGLKPATLSKTITTLSKEVTTNHSILFEAIEQNQTVASKFWIFMGANIHAVNEKNQSTLLVAMKNNLTDLSATLIHAGFNIHRVAEWEYNSSYLHYSAEHHLHEIGRILIDEGANISAVDFSGQTPLHYAASSDNVLFGKLLIEKGAKIQALNMYDVSVLHFATLNDSVEMAQMLINHKADIRAVTVDYMTPLHFAASYSSPKCAELLIENGAPLEVIDKYGSTPLLTAIKSRSEEVALILLKYDVQINIQQNDGNTPLHAAAIQNLPRIAQILLSKNAHINQVNLVGDTPLHVAAKAKSKLIYQLLISFKADTTIKNNDGKTSTELL